MQPRLSSPFARTSICISVTIRNSPVTGIGLNRCNCNGNKSEIPGAIRHLEILATSSIQRVLIIDYLIEEKKGGLASDRLYEGCDGKTRVSRRVISEMTLAVSLQWHFGDHDVLSDSRDLWTSGSFERPDTWQTYFLYTAPFSCSSSMISPASDTFREVAEFPTD